MQKLEKSPRIQTIQTKFHQPINKLLYNWHWKKDLMHKEIGKKLNIPRSTISQWFKKFNIPTQKCHRITNLNLLNVGPKKGPRAKPRIKKEPKCHADKHFFKKWTPEMAYTLGFFLADGTMTINPRGSQYIEFYTIDKDLIFKIRKVLKSNHKIRMRKRGKNQKNTYRLQIGSKKIFKDLLKLNIFPQKTGREKLPKIPKRYFKDFLRGYFDGDGNVWMGYNRRKNRNATLVLSSMFTSGGKTLLASIGKILNKLLALRGSLKYSGRAYRLCYSIVDTIKLYRFMYCDIDENDLFLKRKKIIFEKFLAIHGPVV